MVVRPSTTKPRRWTPTRNLAAGERELLRHIADHADLLDPSGAVTRGRFRGQPMRWLLVPIDERMLARLAAFEADREDLEANGDDEDGGEIEPSVVHPTHGYRPEGVAETMTVTEWRAVR